MQYRIKESIRSLDKKSYAEHAAQTPVLRLDCSMGHNPYGLSTAAKAASLDINEAMLCHYPHDTALIDSICCFWKPYANIRPDQVALCFGSIDGIYAINTLFSGESASVLGISPQFSDYVSNAILLGYGYKGIALPPENAFRFNLQSLLAGIDNSLNLIYIDNPNNPTGQIILLTEIRAIAEAAKKCGVCVLVDEAYGDFMEESASAATLMQEFDNVIVLRTFSKGYGLAGMRIGYLMASRDIIYELNKIRNPYCATSFARLLAGAALGDQSFVRDCRHRFAKSKQRLRTCVGKFLYLAHTADTTPICLLIHQDARKNLEQILVKKGIKTVSGTDFMGLQQNSVRLRLPRDQEEDLLFEALSELNQMGE